MKEGKSVIVVGGTGFLGYYAGLEFLRKGYRVSSLSIPDVELGGWFPEEIERREGDVFSMTPKELREVFAGYDAMVYAVGPDDRAVPDAPAELFFQEKLVRASVRVFEAARDAGIRRAVLLGSYMDYFHRRMPHLRLAERHPYIQARVDQAEQIISLAGRGMDAMVLELPYIFGSMPGRIPLWREVFFERLLKMNPVLYPDGGSAMVCVESVAQAIVGAVERGETATRYAIGDDNLRWREMFTIMFEAIGVKRYFLHVPHWLAAIAGHWMMSKERRRKKEPGLHLARIFRDVISQDFFLESEKTARDLGYVRCDVRAAIAATARACYPGGYRGRNKE